MKRLFKATLVAAVLAFAAYFARKAKKNAEFQIDNLDFAYDE